jgi:hypothetical protein
MEKLEQLLKKRLVQFVLFYRITAKKKKYNGFYYIIKQSIIDFDTSYNF